MADENNPRVHADDPAGKRAERVEPSVSARPAGAGGSAPGNEPGAEGREGVSAQDASAEGRSAQSEDVIPQTLAARLEEAQQQLESYKDQVLRAQAEAENTRRRAGRDVENAHKYALEKFTADLLAVLDSLEKAVELASGSAPAGSMAEGVELSLKLFLSVLDKHGVQRVDPVGEPFDPQLHEAMTVVPSPHAEPNSVLEVMQPGYVLNGRLVRAAKVVVARAPDPGSRDGAG
jgi:molecular chaperone GrpE